MSTIREEAEQVTNEFIDHRNNVESYQLDPWNVISVSKTKSHRELNELVEGFDRPVTSLNPPTHQEFMEDLFHGITILPPIDYSPWIEERRAVAQKLIADNITDQEVWKEKLGGWENI